MAFDLKSATPDTSFPANGVLFGADSQSASDPSVYSHLAYLNYILGLAPLTSGYVKNLGIVASVAANALTISLKGADGSDPSASNPVAVLFRSPTLATGTPVARSLTAATSLVISSGSTMGATNSVPFRLWLVLIDDGGTLRLGAVNCDTSGGGIQPLNEAVMYSSTAEGGAGAADSAGVIYTDTAASAKAIRVLGYLEWGSGLATVGTWSAGPTTIEMYQPGVNRPGETWGSRYVTSTETWTTPVGTTEIEFEAWGGGGSGAGGDTTASQRGAGGGAGAYLFKRIKSGIDASYVLTIGAGGAAATSGAGGTTGNAGSSTTIVGTNLGTLTAGGGSGGGAGINAGGAGGTVTGTVDVSITGQAGFTSFSNLAATLQAVFPGGSSPRGGAGGTVNVGSAGVVPGGGGSCGNHTAATSSGAGAAGAVNIRYR